MSTAFVQLSCTFRSVILTILACTYVSFASTLVIARDLFPLSPEAATLKKAAAFKLIPVQKMIPDIVIDLKYATPDNVTKSTLYPSNMPCLLHRMTLTRLARAQKSLRKMGLRLKIWDAYRPLETQLILWKASKSSKYVVPPEKGPSLHSYGVAVDVTIVDKKGQDLLMPSAHDEFSLAAASDYSGDNPLIRYNLDILQKAMKKAGFSTIKDEWWHFVNMEAQAARSIHARQLGIQLPTHPTSVDSSKP